MPYPIPTNAPFDLGPGPRSGRWLYLGNGAPVPIVGRSRRTITVDCFGQRLRLCRRRLERAGVDTVGSLQFRVTTYQLPGEAA